VIPDVPHEVIIQGRDAFWDQHSDSVRRDQVDAATTAGYVARSEETVGQISDLHDEIERLRTDNERLRQDKAALLAEKDRLRDMLDTVARENAARQKTIQGLRDLAHTMQIPWLAAAVEGQGEKP
jgi:uncharacterized protein (DUF3084 family)